MIFDGVDEELSAPAIDHWKSVTETTIANATFVTSVETNILTIRRQACVVSIGYVIIIISRVEEEEETQYNESLKSSVTSALESEEYFVALIEDDSSGESAFANVTTIQTGELIDAFQIRTNYEAFDFSGNTTRTWCLSSWKYATCQEL